MRYFETGCDLIDRMRTTALIESVKSGAVPEEFRDTREPEPKKSFWKRALEAAQEKAGAKPLK